MRDEFADIAASYKAGEDRGLECPEPIEVSDKIIQLSSGEIGAFALSGKITNNKQLRERVEEKKKQFAPFLEDLAPKPSLVEKRIQIKNFEFSLNGGEKENITLPHYHGPCCEQSSEYFTDFELNLEDFSEKKVILCFKGVDYIANVFVNNEFVGSHEGFFAPFEFDITSVAKVGKNTLRVIVKNMQKMQFGGDKIYASTGLGWDDPYCGWHHCPAGFGIYNDVFVEVRNQAYIADIFPRFTEEKQEIWVECESAFPDNDDYYFSVSVYGQNFKHTEFENMRIVPETIIRCGLNDTFTEAIMEENGRMNRGEPLKLGTGFNRFVIPVNIANVRLWSNETPYLYKVVVELYYKNELMSVKSRQFGIRYFKQDLDSSPKGKFYLNGEEIRLRGANTMGFEQQDVLRKDYDQLIEDILLAKIANMNFWRITQRPVQEEIYDYCDRLGLMIQTDFPTFGCIKINQYCEVLRQTEEMEKLVRAHPCCIIDTYINEPFPNANNQPNRMLTRNELEKLFKAMDDIVHLQNPERVIKHIDGDYDPPDDLMPDNHCYTMWYNGHGIDFGKLHKGYWMDVKPGWHYGCGEYGAEGLENVELMKKRYPEEWISEPFNPQKILCCQTASFHRFFFETPDSIEEWVEESQKYQSFAVREMTTCLRRNKNMNSFAIHLFIDAFPSGWLKAIMDCERTPKKAYFDYADCLSPIFCSLRSDRFTFFENENVEIESYICNDKNEAVDEIKYFVTLGEKIICSGKQLPENGISQGKIAFVAPNVEKRSEIMVFMGAFKEGKLLHYASEKYEIFPTEKLNKPQLLPFNEYIENKEKFDSEIFSGKKMIITNAPIGENLICGKKILVKRCNMGAVYAGNRNTGHICVQGLEKNDFRYFYDSSLDRLSPISETTFSGDDIEYIIFSGNKNSEDKWQNEALCAEWQYGKGRVVVSQLLLDSKESNPCVVRFLNNLNEFIK